jgi:aldose 1-epimerase
MLTWFNLKSPSLPVVLLQHLSGTPYFGAVVGRVANRVASGKFKLDGKEYTLEQNNGPNALHGTQLVLFLAAWERAGPGGGGGAWVNE